MGCITNGSLPAGWLGERIYSTMPWPPMVQSVCVSRKAAQLLEGTIDGLNTTTSRVEVPVPTDVELNRSYYVGAVVDPDNQLNEQDEFNATYTLVTFVE